MCFQYIHNHFLSFRIFTFYMNCGSVSTVAYKQILRYAALLTTQCLCTNT